jgi:hypothetical protein
MNAEGYVQPCPPTAFLGTGTSYLGHCFETFTTMQYYAIDIRTRVRAAPILVPDPIGIAWVIDT